MQQFFSFELEDFEDHWCMSRQNFGCAKEFGLDSTKHARKIFQNKWPPKKNQPLHPKTAPFMSIWSLRAPLFSNQRLLDAICAQMLQSF